MVVAPHFAAAEAGRAVLAEGGNAVEAAIAVAASIAVVYPHMNSIGGDGFWLIHRPGQPVVAIDACGRAATKADLALYAGLESVPCRGPLAANTVAGAISGWAKAREIAPGQLPLSRLMAEAVAYARDGVSVTAGGAALAAAKSAELRDLPGAYAQIFEPEGKPLAEGDCLRQPALARTLERLAQDGLDSFYRGEIAGSGQ
jgi:gamma-glutamyltranspeptidase/glutathione hydrolase